MTVTDADALVEMVGDIPVPCDAKSQSCNHEAVALILFFQHDHAKGTENPWWSACQTHLDAASQGATGCTGCKRPLQIQQTRPF